MSSPSFLNMLLFFPKDNINGEMVELLQPYLRMEDFNIETAKKVNNAYIDSFVLRSNDRTAGYDYKVLIVFELFMTL